MPIQTLLRIGLPEGTLIYPSRFRELLAKQPDMPPALFHRNADGKTCNDLPGLLTIGGRQWLGILAQPGYEDVLYQAMGLAVRVLTLEAGKSVPVDVQRLELDINRAHTPITYFVREMAIKRRYQAARSADIESLVKTRILAGLARLADRYNLDIPTEEQLGLDVSVHKNIGMRLETTNGLSNEYVSLVDARISMFAELKGHWMVGNLTSRGYGRIGRDLQTLAVHFQKEETRERRMLK